MLKLFNRHNTLLGMFNDYPQLQEFLVKHHARECAYNPSWSFIHYSHADLCIFHAGSSSEKLTAVENFSLNRGLGLISLNQGGGERYCVQIPLLPDLDVGLYIEDWCRRYCYACHLLVVTTKEGEELDHDLVI